MGHLSGKVCLFQGRENRQLLAKRPWITQTEAAALLRVRQGAIASLIARGVLLGEIHPAGRRGRSVGLVSRESVESLKSELHSALDVRTTATRLGIGRHAVLDLIHVDRLLRAVRTAKGWRILVRSVRDTEAMCAGLPQATGPTADFMSLRQATRLAGPSGLGLTDLLRLIQCGSLRAWRTEPHTGLKGIAVSRTALAAVQQEARDRSEPLSDWSLHRATRNLFPGRPIKASVLKKWIKAGFIQARKSGATTMISAAEIRRFRAEYCRAQEAVRILGITRSTLSRWEVQGRITPVYGKRVIAHAGFSLYRREDLRRLVDATPYKARKRVGSRKGHHVGLRDGRFRR